MIRFVKVDGVEAENSALPQVNITPEGQAMGAVPGWAVMLDPTYIELPTGFSGETALNRASGRLVSATRDSTDPEKVEEDGLDFIRAYGDSYLQFLGDRDIDPERWSMVAVFKKDPDSTNRPRNFIVISEPGDTGEGISLSISHSTQSGRVIVYEYDENVENMPQRISADASLLDNELKLVIVTFSVDNGLKIYVDGELLAEEPDDRRPLTHGFEAGEYRLMRFFRGQWGMVGMLNTDLGAAENTGHRRAIEKFLMDNYSISA